MVDNVNWDSFGKNSKLPPQPQNEGSDGGKYPPLLFMKMSSGPNGEEMSYTIRPLLACVMFYKYVLKHNGSWRSAICEDPQSCPIFTKHQIRPQERYAINVIDRATGEIKILESTYTVFKEFKKFFDHTQRDPGKAQGADFLIQVKGKGEKTRYTCEFAGNTVLTDEERAMVKEHGLFKLDKIFKVTPADRIEDKLFGEPQAKKEASAKTSEADIMDAFGTGESEAVSVASDDLTDELDI